MIQRYRLTPDTRGQITEQLFITEQLHKRGRWVEYKGVKKIEKELRDLKEDTRWRDVKVELPEESLTVIIQEKDSVYSYFGYYVKDAGWWTVEPSGEETDVTHWMPRPELKESGVDHETK